MTPPIYSFAQAPPAVPELYFDDKKLVQMAIWGSLACPYSPPQYTVFPGEGQVGRWTLHFDALDPLSTEALEQSWKWLTEQLPGMRMRYEDFGTGESWIWVLTDELAPFTIGDQPFQYGDPTRGLRLGRWPD